MAGRPQKFTIDLTDDERVRLESIANARSSQVRHSQRAQIILLRAQGSSYEQICQKLKVSQPTVSKVLKKVATLGVDRALEDLQRSGRPSVIGLEARTWVIALACQLPETVPHGPFTQQWTIASLTEYVQKNAVAQGHKELANVQPSTIWKILNSRDIKPHRIQYYLDVKDPEFIYKAKEVLLIYKRVEWILQMTKDERDQGFTVEELTGQAFLSYDEKPGIQAVGTVAPDLPPGKKFKGLARDYEYKRFGTVSLLAGIDLVTGKVIGMVRDKHTSAEFIEFLSMAHQTYPENVVINVILDNHSVHNSKETLDFLETLPNGRFHFVFTPKHASWLNIIESFFSKLARQALRNLRVKSKSDLVARIEHWLRQLNEEPVVFRWRSGLEDIDSDIKAWSQG